ncbi:MAG: hypothetical protein KDB73_19595 [Planctomycetes bacterium]|nr:hypothetical protein [Planctomycetota bacterium]
MLLTGVAGGLFAAWLIVRSPSTDVELGTPLEGEAPSTCADTLSGMARPPELMASGGSADQQTDGPAAPEHGPVRLFVDRPAPMRILLGVLGGPRDGELIAATAAAQGFDLPDVPYDGSTRIVLLSPREQHAAPIVGSVTGPRLTLAIPGGPLLCDVHAVDTASGRDVDGAKHRGENGLPLPASISVDPRVPFGRWDEPHPPRGWAVFPVPVQSYTPSLRARRLLLHLPLTHEADVVVEAGPGGTRGHGELRVLAAEVAGKLVRALVAEIAGPDMVRLHGVPWLPREPLRVLVAAGPPEYVERDGEETSEELSPLERAWSRDTWFDPPEGSAFADPGKLTIGVARLPSTRNEPARVAATFDRTERLASEVQVDSDVAYSEDYPPAWAPGFGAVRVLVRDSTGDPLPFVRVECAGKTHLADELGACLFERVAPQLQPVALIEPGWTLTRARVEVRRDEVVEIELREQEGGRIVFSVKDDQNQPLSAADIRVPDGAAWADVDADGVQRLDIRTDQRGLRALERFPVGRWHFEVAYGLRRATASVTVTTGATTTVDLTLPPVPDPAASTDD